MGVELRSVRALVLIITHSTVLIPEVLHGAEDPGAHSNGSKKEKEKIGSLKYVRGMIVS
jgi:hypothetical protein